MSVDLVGFVNLVGVAYQDPRGNYIRLHYCRLLDDFLAFKVIWELRLFEIIP